MAEPRPRYCRSCGKVGTKDNPVSRRGLHTGCSKAKVAETVEQLHHMEGPIYDRWKANLLASMQRIDAE